MASSIHQGIARRAGTALMFLMLSIHAIVWLLTPNTALAATQAHAFYQFFRTSPQNIEDYVVLDVESKVEDDALCIQVNPNIQEYRLRTSDMSWRVVLNFAGGTPWGERNVTADATYDDETGTLRLPASYATENISFVAQIPWMHPAHNLVAHWDRRAAHDMTEPSAVMPQALSDDLAVGNVYRITNVVAGASGTTAPRMLGKDFDTHGLATLCGYPELESRYAFFVAFQKSNCRLFELVDALPGRPGASGTVTTDYGDVIPYDLRGSSWVTADCIEDVNNGREIFFVLEDDGSWVRVDAMDSSTLHCTFRLSVNGPGGANYQDVMGKFDLAIPYGALRIQKRSTNPDISTANSCYSLRGALYGVYDHAECTHQTGTLTTDEHGNATLDKLTPGSYWIKELQAPQGFARDETVYTATVCPGETVVVNGGAVWDRPLYATVPLTVRKTDTEGGTTARGAGTLTGATFKVAYFDGAYNSAEALPDTAQRTWFVTTADLGDGTIGIRLGDIRCDTHGDTLFTSADDTVLPLGTLAISEVAAPDGYLLSDMQTRIVHVVADAAAAGGASLRTIFDKEAANGGENATLTVCDQVKRGDFDLTKVNGATMVRLGGVPFAISSDTTGETHIIMTDENGYASTSASWLQHTHATNANDAAATYADGEWQVNESLLEAEAGIWFSGHDSADSSPDDTLGALPYDSYTITELPVRANDGLALVSFSVTVRRDGTTVACGTISDGPAPAIVTTLTEQSSGMHVTAASSSVTLQDRIRYSSLTPGDTYEVRGVLHAVGSDGSDGGILTTDDGAPIAAQTTFVADQAEGEATVTFTLDATMLAGTSIVAFETLVKGSHVVATHADANDADQMVSFAALETLLMDAETGDKVVSSNGMARVIDTISYQGLTPGATYQLKGTLMDAETGEAATMSGGDAITGETTFVPEASSGTTRVTFDFDASEQAGRTLVAYQTLYDNDAKLVVHADLHNAAQTVTTPGIATNAHDAATGTHEALAAANAEIVDVVLYENLAPGMEYELITTLVAAQTGEPIAGSIDYPAERTIFTAQEKTGTIEVAIPVDATHLAGMTVAVCEYLYQDGRIIAQHADATDAAQSIRYPRIVTEATSETGTHETLASASATITDTVSYQGLTPGIEYVIAGALHRRDGNGTDAGAVDDGHGHGAVASMAFVPDSTDGTLQLSFNIDARSLAGSDIVAFEQIVRDGHVVAEHADISSDAQSLTVVREAKGTSLPRTGDDGPGILPIVLLGISAVLFMSVGIVLRRAPVACSRESDTL